MMIPKCTLLDFVILGGIESCGYYSILCHEDTKAQSLTKRVLENKTCSRSSICYK